MQTIKKVKYEIERVGNSTFCTMSCNLEYILSHLEGAKLIPTEAKNGVNLRICPSKEETVFAKNLTPWGFYLDNPTITVVAKITLSENDKDDQKVANRIVRDKAMHTMCSVIANALDKAVDSTYTRLASISSMVDKLDTMANPSNWGDYTEDYVEEEVNNIPDPADDPVDVADII